HNYRTSQEPPLLPPILPPPHPPIHLDPYAQSYHHFAPRTAPPPPPPFFNFPFPHPFLNSHTTAPPHFHHHSMKYHHPHPHSHHHHQSHAYPTHQQPYSYHPHLQRHQQYNTSNYMCKLIVLLNFYDKVKQNASGHYEHNNKMNTYIILDVSDHINVNENMKIYS
ncbi:unnamed protein product, partial [Adineta steineri]